jgi:tetratricopeptide (TPR) repeat protein
LGNRDFAATRYESALDFYSRALRLEPTSHALYSNRAATFMALHNYEDALKDADKAVELNPKWHKVRQAQ